MGKTQRQKDLLTAYKDRPVVGGVCAVKNIHTGRVLLLPTATPESQRNRFSFSVSTDCPLLPAMAADWKEYGAAAFQFFSLETLEKQPAQTDKQFQAELDLLGEIWRERLTAEGTEFY